MNLSAICVYTIIHPARLDEAARRGRPISLTEKTKWTRIAAAVTEAHAVGQDVAVVFTDARRCDLLFAWAPLADVVVGDGTTFSLTDLHALPGKHHKMELTTFVGKEGLSPRHIRPYVPCETPEFLIDAARVPVRWTYTLDAFYEGRAFLKTHVTRERNAQLRAAKIREAGADLRCEVCTFDFAASYPGVGDGFIEIHHRAPLGERVPEGAATALEDLALVCANCHRMLHRSEVVSIPELRAVLRPAVA